MAKMKKLDWIAIVLLIIGGLNWGLIGLFGLNIVELLFGTSIVTKAIYVLVGASAGYSVFSLMKANK